MAASSTMCSGSLLPRAARLLLTALAALALAACAAPVDPSRVQAVEAAQLSGAVDAGKVRLIDVRRADEGAKGMIAGAEHIPIGEFDPAMLDLSDGREVVFYCHSGRRSARAAQQLSNRLGRKVKHLEGGIDAWEAAALPITRP